MKEFILIEADTFLLRTNILHDNTGNVYTMLSCSFACLSRWWHVHSVLFITWVILLSLTKDSWTLVF